MHVNLESVDSRLLALQNASARLPPGSAFSGFTALWLHGLDFDPCDPIEATVPAPARISTRAGVVIRRRLLQPGDIIQRRRLPTTKMLRTIRDLCLRLTLTEAVVVADAALHAGLVTTTALIDSASLVAYGVAMLRKVTTHVEPLTESPMETRMRMLFVLNGLERPEAQVPIYDGHRFLGRVDLYYRDARLAIEYDGANHNGKLADDDRRQNLLMAAGVRLLRFTAGDIYNAPDRVVSQVRRELARAS